jgi:hypothetical protein
LSNGRKDRALLALHPGENLEAFGTVGSLDDLDRPFADFGERLAQFVASVTAIGKDVAQPGEAVPDAGEYIGCAVTILDIGGVHDGSDEEPCVSVTIWRLRPLIFLPAS